MTDARVAPGKTLPQLEWALAITLFETGLLQAGLPGAPAATGHALAPAGLAQALVAVLLVVPSATGFVPVLAPLAAAAVTVAFGAAASGLAVPFGLGSPPFALAVALAAAAVAVGRGVLVSVAPLDLGPETADPWERRSGRPVGLRLERPGLQDAYSPSRIR